MKAANYACEVQSSNHKSFDTCRSMLAHLGYFQPLSSRQVEGPGATFFKVEHKD